MSKEYTCRVPTAHTIMPPTRDTPQFSKQVTIVIGLTVVGFMAFGLTLSFYRNIVFEETLRRISGENAEIAKDIEHGYAELEYYRSTQFRDKFAKENFNRANPGERVLIITSGNLQQTVSDDGETITEKERKETAYIELLRQMPVIEHWQLYLFERSKIEQIKRAL